MEYSETTDDDRRMTRPAHTTTTDVGWTLTAPDARQQLKQIAHLADILNKCLISNIKYMTVCHTRSGFFSRKRRCYLTAINQLNDIRIYHPWSYQTGGGLCLFSYTCILIAESDGNLFLFLNLSMKNIS